MKCLFCMTRAFLRLGKWSDLKEGVSLSLVERVSERLARFMLDRLWLNCSIQRGGEVWKMSIEELKSIVLRTTVRARCFEQAGPRNLRMWALTTAPPLGPVPVDNCTT